MLQLSSLILYKTTFLKLKAKQTFVKNVDYIFLL